MLLPKYSIRLLLLIMVAVALYALLITVAMRGAAWAFGVAFAIGSLGVVAVVHAALFLFVLLLGQISMPRRPSRALESEQLPRPPLPEAPH